MTDTVAAARAELDAAILKYAQAVADAAITAAQPGTTDPAPDPEPETPAASLPLTTEVINAYDKSLLLPLSSLIVAGQVVVQLATGQAVNVLEVDEVQPLAGRDPVLKVTTDQNIANPGKVVGKAATVRDRYAKAETSPTPPPSVEAPAAVELVKKLQVKAKGSLKGLAKAVIGVNHGQSGGGYVLPGKQGTDFGFASEVDIKLLASKGVTRVRISLLWPRIVRTLGGDIDPTYGALLLQALKLYGKYGITALVCGAHDYGGYASGARADQRDQLGSAKVPQGSLANMYAKLARFVSADPQARAALYGYDLMNEPINLADPMVIVREYQLCIDAIRQVDQTCAIAVEPYPWATTRDFASYGQALFTLKDPSKLLEIHTHCYFDADAGGDYAEDDSTIDPIQAIDRMKGVIAACKAAGFKHAFGEMGAPASKRVGNSNVPTPNAVAALANGIAYALASGSDVYLWWWSEYQANDWDNINSITAPRNSDVLAVLQQYL
ncbi:cellulase family glycosylhydrolase [Pseudomonas rhizoryzae]|uniref:cellulase family glycosylhydrolase n=1 Tax=Pseudomonas rhizoryzae TaxID=2571129 RepID=UPI0010C21D22|nr:cellulase family glycosylhydrolase [Pseudomonas rhizoryzae]